MRGIPLMIVRGLIAFVAVVVVGGGALAACSSGFHTAGSGPAPAAASSAAADAQNVLAAVQKDPGYADVKAAANACAPLQGNQLETVVLVSSKDVKRTQRYSLYKARYTILKYLANSGNRHAFENCVTDHTQMTQAQKSKFGNCFGTQAFAVKLSQLKTGWQFVQKWALGALLGSYDYAVGHTNKCGASAVAIPNPSS